MPYSMDSFAVDVLRDPDAKAVVDRYLPGALDLPLVGLILVTLSTVTQQVQFSAGVPENIDAMWDELAALPSSPARSGPQPDPVPSAPADPADAACGDPEITSIGPAEQWGIIEISLPGPSGGNPFVDVDLHVVVTGPDGLRIRAGGFLRRRRHLQGPSATAPARPMDFSRPLQLRHARWSERRVRSTLALAAEPRTCSGRRQLPLRPRGRYSVPPDRNHRVRLDSPGRRPRGGHAGNPDREPVQQDQDVRVPQVLPVQHQRAAAVSLLRDEEGEWDFSRFNTAFFHHLERRILDLASIGIESDLIIFHAYDRWGYSQMPAWADDLYLRYVTRRLSAFRTVWWSLANEYDLLTKKSLSDWERLAAIIGEEDPVGHLLSIHNCFEIYDNTKPWVTHCSIQRIDAHKTSEITDGWRRQFGKPSGPR